MKEPLPQDNNVFEYLVTIEPQEALKERILQIRSEFNEEFHYDHFLSTPHLLLLKFRQNISLEDRVMRHIHRAAMSHPPFRIDLNDFGCIPCHTIYIDISLRSGFQSFSQHLKSETQHLLKHENDKPHFISEQRFDIATRLAPWQFEKGWMKYASENFSASFIAEQITVLRKKEGTSKYFPVQRFKLMNLTSVAQGKLFI